jgi:hypothetical protein
MILAFAGAAAVLPAQRELYGGGFERRLALIEVVASFVSVVAATSAAVIGAFALPASLGTSTLWRAGPDRRALDDMYETGVTPVSPQGADAVVPDRPETSV